MTDEASAQRAAPPGPSARLCGRHCLAVVLRIFGDGEENQRLDQEIDAALGPPAQAGYSLGELAEVAESRGLHTRLVETGPENLLRRPRPFQAIAHVDGGRHFILIGDLDSETETATIFDTAGVPGVTRTDWAVLRERWDGTALLVSPEPLLAEEDLPWTTAMWLTGVGLPALAVGIVVVGIAGWFLRRRR